MPQHNSTFNAPWKIIEEHIYETFKIFRLKKSGRINPRTGKRFDFFLMDGLDWANVIALTSDNKVILVKQYRHGSESFTYEIPGGCVEVEENPSNSAARELKEETGYETKLDLEFLGTIHPNPAMQAMRCHCYIARNVERTREQTLDPGEDIEVIVRSLPEIKEMILSGAISHSIVLAAFALFQLRDASLNGRNIRATPNY